MVNENLRNSQFSSIEKFSKVRRLVQVKRESSGAAELEPDSSVGESVVRVEVSGFRCEIRDVSCGSTGKKCPGARSRT